MPLRRKHVADFDSKDVKSDHSSSAEAAASSSSSSSAAASSSPAKNKKQRTDVSDDSIPIDSDADDDDHSDDESSSAAGTRLDSRSRASTLICVSCVAAFERRCVVSAERWRTVPRIDSE